VSRGNPSVGVAGFRLNPALADYLKRNRSRTVSSVDDSASPEAQSYVRIPQQRRVRARLTEADITDIVESFKQGTAKHVLATRYSISLTTVKKLLHERGVKGQPGMWSRNTERTG